MAESGNHEAKKRPESLQSQPHAPQGETANPLEAQDVTAIQRAATAPQMLRPGDIARVQHTAGNQTAARLIQAKPASAPRTAPPAIQAKPAGSEPEAIQCKEESSNAVSDFFSGVGDMVESAWNTVSDFVTGNSSTGTGGAKGSAAAAPTGVVTVNGLNVRPQPNLNNTPLAVLNQGAKVKIVGDSGAFWKIQHGAGLAYVSKKFIQVGGAAPTKKQPANNNSTPKSTANNTPSHSSGSTTQSEVIPNGAVTVKDGAKGGKVVGIGDQQYSFKATSFTNFDGTKTSGHVYNGKLRPEVESLEKKLTDLKLPADAARVMALVSRHEGGFDTIQTYDKAKFSWGFIQFAGSGGLHSLMTRIKENYPKDFEEYFGKNGIDVDKGQVIIRKKDKVLTGDAALTELHDNPTLWACFIRASNDVDIQAAQVLSAYRDYYVPIMGKEVAFNGGSRTLGDLFKASDYGRAVLFDRAVQRGVGSAKKNSGAAGLFQRAIKASKVKTDGVEDLQKILAAARGMEDPRNQGRYDSLQQSFANPVKKSAGGGENSTKNQTNNQPNNQTNNQNTVKPNNSTIAPKILFTGTVSASQLNVRSETNSSNNQNILGKLFQGAQVPVIAKSGEWLQIQYGDGSKPAYVFGQFVTEPGKTPVQNPTENKNTTQNNSSKEAKTKPTPQDSFPISSKGLIVKNPPGKNASGELTGYYEEYGGVKLNSTLKTRMYGLVQYLVDNDMVTSVKFSSGMRSPGRAHQLAVSYCLYKGIIGMETLKKLKNSRGEQGTDEDGNVWYKAGWTKDQVTKHAGSQTAYASDGYKSSDPKRAPVPTNHGGPSKHCSGDAMDVFIYLKDGMTRVGSDGKSTSSGDIANQKSYEAVKKADPGRAKEAMGMKAYSTLAKQVFGEAGLDRPLLYWTGGTPEAWHFQL